MNVYRLGYSSCEEEATFYPCGVPDCLRVLALVNPEQLQSARKPSLSDYDGNNEE